MCFFSVAPTLPNIYKQSKQKPIQIYLFVNTQQMKIKNFKCKVFKPCKKILNLFKFKLHKPVFIRALKFRHRKPKDRMTTTYEGRLPRILSVLHSFRRTREVDRVTELKSFSDAGHHRAPYPSPLTPAYVRMSGVNGAEVKEQDEVEDACRSFENYLIEMIVEEGKMRDLVDVEELLYCWKNLTSPVFIDLVCRFYGELCKDLFSDSCQEDNGMKKGYLSPAESKFETRNAPSFNGDIYLNTL